MPTLLAPPPASALDLFGDPLRPPTRRERHRVATVRGKVAASTQPATAPSPTPALPLSPAAEVPAPTAAPPLHPRLWRASELGHSHTRCHPSGFAALDAELPGGGWPTRAITELLLPQAGCAEWRLLAPALAQRTRAGGRLLLIAPPHAPHPRGLAAWGIGAADCLWITPTDHRQGLWALEQAIKADADETGAVLAWLPQLRPEHMRRLQTLASGCRAPVFVLRSSQHAQQASAAPLRLQVQPGVHWAQLQLQIVKRRGPPPLAPLQLYAPPPTLLAVLAPAWLPAPAPKADHGPHPHSPEAGGDGGSPLAPSPSPPPQPPLHLPPHAQHRPVPLPA